MSERVTMAVLALLALIVVVAAALAKWGPPGEVAVAIIRDVAIALAGFLGGGAAGLAVSRRIGNDGEGNA